MDASKVREILHYSPETGIFTWKASRGGVKAGTVAGCIRTTDGYWKIGSHLAHRLAWLYVHGEWPADQIDHVNGDRRDNRLCNLRAVTQQQNLHNVKPHKDNEAGRKGIYLHKRTGRYRARIMVNGRQRHLGYFDTADEAYRAYCVAAEKLHGEFARIA